MGTRQTRLFKIDWIMDRIKFTATTESVLDEKEFVAGFCLFHGSGKATALDILNDLELTKKIVRVGGQIFLPEQYKLLIQEKTDEDLQKILKDSKPIPNELKNGKPST